jgi:hypothetical protein
LAYSVPTLQHPSPLIHGRPPKASLGIAVMDQHARVGLPEFASDEAADPSVDPVTSAVFPLSSSIPSPRFWRFIRR